jgi:hypothetical protein
METTHNTLGIRYDSAEYSANKDINSIDKFFTSLIAISTRDRYSPDSNVLSIDVGKITVLDFKNPKVLKKAFKVGASRMSSILKKIE